MEVLLKMQNNVKLTSLPSVWGVLAIVGMASFLLAVLLSAAFTLAALRRDALVVRTVKPSDPLLPSPRTQSETVEGFGVVLFGRDIKRRGEFGV